VSPLAERHVRAVHAVLTLLPVFHVDVRDPIVVLADEVHRVAEIACHPVADVEIGPVVPRGRERRLEHRLRRLGVAVIADGEGVLVGELPDPLDAVGFQLARDRARAGGLRQPEGVVHLRVGEVVDVVELDDIDLDPGVVELLARR
jgi:hypothetical protein